MVTQDEIRRLVEGPIRPKSPILSLYWNVDPSLPDNRGGAQRSTLHAMLQNAARGLTGEAREDFLRDAARVESEMEHYVPRGKTHVMFCDDSENFVWMRDLAISLPADVRWGPLPYVQPLVEAVDEFERYGVVLADKVHARLFVFSGGELEEARDAFSDPRRRAKRIKGVGSTEEDVQDRSDEWTKVHLRNVARLVSRLVSKFALDRLLVAGTDEVRAELHRQLSKPVLAKVAGDMRLDFGASLDQIREATAEAIRRHEREDETLLVETLITQGRKKKKAAIGFHLTLDAVRDRHVNTLVYAEGLRARGGQCPQCTALYTESSGPCAHCGADVKPVGDLLEIATDYVLQNGGKIEFVKGEAAEKLRSVEGIGAFLRH